MERRKTTRIRVGGLTIGGEAPVSVQGMAKVPTGNVPSLVRQVRRMVRSGAELVRVSVLRQEETESIRILKERFSVPVIADIHYDVRLAIASLEAGADKIRINPGNIRRPQLRHIIREAGDRGVPIRIGINSGSIRLQGGLVKSVVSAASDTIKLFEDEGFHSLVISLKTPFVRETMDCYEGLAPLCNYPFHLGITEAGRGHLAEAKSVLGIGALLLRGIGDTIRVSLTEPPEKEIVIGRAILQAAGLRTFEPEIISCPTCGRTQVNLAAVEKQVRREVTRLALRYPRLLTWKIAVMGCSVNGPGEARQADIGIAGGKGRFALFTKGRVIRSCPEAVAVTRLVGEIRRALRER